MPITSLSFVIIGFSLNSFTILSKEFNLEVKGLRPVLIVSIGYHSEDDFNAKLKKSRLSKDKVITVL